MDGSIVAQRYQRASEETRLLVDRLLELDLDDSAWAAQLGPAYRQADVASLLGKSKQAVSEDRRLLRLQMRSGVIGYPAFQFDGRRLLPGIADTVAILTPAVETAWTTASWLTSPQPTLDDARPLDLLRAGGVDRVIAAAHRMAAALAR